MPALLNRNSAAAKLLQSSLTLCDPIDDSPTGSAVPGILQARILEWVAISFSSAWKWKVKVKSLSRVQLLVTPWTAAYQAPPYMRLSRKEYQGGVPLPSPSILLGLNRLCIATFFRCQSLVQSLSHVRLFVTTWTAAYQAPPSMRLSRQEYWSGLPLPSLFCIVLCILATISASVRSIPFLSFLSPCLHEMFPWYL